ncbi:alkaline phosphatase family protein [Mycoplasma sp. SG1]|uniref:alkaline phosphatase family protein n=1 Tax=Mycoplasma sp. SG1 TaxID=2810348 RepID=UPI0020249FD9|nr:alkaline phosphatase family protein [Mycoplasma sp. SG1]URM52786.1 alkaline phosphatase family protein [Mycoplasma sp. SG1]
MKKTLDSTNQIKHTIIFGADAFGSYLIRNNLDNLPNLKKIIKDGAYSLKSHAVFPSVSANNWNTLMRGVSTNIHGKTEWNSSTPELDKYDDKYLNPPSIVKLTKERFPNKKVAVFFRWPQWNDIVELDLADYYYNPVSKEDQEHWGTTPKSLTINYQDNMLVNYDIVDKAIEYFKKEKPFLLIIYVNEPDTTGHVYGHQTDYIFERAKVIDYWLGEVLKMIEEDDEVRKTTLLTFLADHGGVACDDECHGGLNPLELTVPMIFYGKMVKRWHIPYPLMHYDFAKTLLWRLDIPFPDYWNGKNLSFMFKDWDNGRLCLYQRYGGATYALYWKAKNIFLSIGEKRAIDNAIIFAKKNKIQYLYLYDEDKNLLKRIKISI